MTGDVRRRRPPIKAIDFFCGAGGLTRGLLDCGIKVLAGVDNDSRLEKTYSANNSPSRFLERDITKVDIVELRAELGITDRDVVLYAACTPCQPFSTLNQRRGGDDRKELLLDFAEMVRVRPPDLIVVENVPGLGNAYGREVNAEFQAVLDEAGFEWRDARLVDASDHGVPQVRKRYLMVASRLGPISLPRTSRAPKATVRDALGRFGPAHLGLEGGHSSSAASADVARRPAGAPANHVARIPSAKHLGILRAVPADGGSRSDVVDTSLLLECHRKSPKLHKDVFGRMSWDAPAPTLTCRCTDVYCGRFAHPEEDRGLSLREAAALQTFPDDYVFHGTFHHAARQIGNAVPVGLARAVASRVVASASLPGARAKAIDRAAGTPVA